MRTKMSLNLMRIDSMMSHPFFSSLHSQISLSYYLRPQRMKRRFAFSCQNDGVLSQTSYRVFHFYSSTPLSLWPHRSLPPLNLTTISPFALTDESPSSKCFSPSLPSSRRSSWMASCQQSSSGWVLRAYQACYYPSCESCSLARGHRYRQREATTSHHSCDDCHFFQHHSCMDCAGLNDVRQLARSALTPSQSSL